MSPPSLSTSFSRSLADAQGLVSAPPDHAHDAHCHCVLSSNPFRSRKSDGWEESVVGQYDLPRKYLRQYWSDKSDRRQNNAVPLRLEMHG
jgi:hypothetical protein